jgi:predicted metal-dependent HD superfamily phosphohydrolase
MMEADEQLLQDARDYVTDIFTNRVQPAFLFHNLDHTRYVTKAAGIMADYYQLPDNDRLALLLGCWFHDTGYSGGEITNHEELSKSIATRFLTGKNADAELIEKVNGCIAATKMPQTPSTLIEQIICDADLFHLGAKSFFEKTKILRRELNLLQDKKIGKKEWREKNVLFLQQHRFFTTYARTKLEPLKHKHLEQLLNKDIDPENIPEEKPVKPVSLDREVEKMRKEKEGRVERSISTMFRIMSNNHVNLSHMADSKANIMISVNTIVISIIVSVLTGKLQFYPEFIIPTIMLLCVCLTAIVFAILATRPNVTRGTFTKEDIQGKKVNLLFFGNFYNMSLPDYDWAMKEMMKDNEYLNSNMIKDIYFLGVVLAKKYKFLRLSYNTFMFGLIIAIVAFAIAFLVGSN